ncbi:MAG: efflux RND transporter periplasmic adaptor subunit [Planctomycetota bacterium]
MQPNSSQQATLSAGEIRQEISQSLRELQQLADSRLEPGAFYAELLERIVRVAGGVGGAVWIAGPRGDLHLFAERSLSSAIGNARGAIDRERRRLATYTGAEGTDDRHATAPANRGPRGPRPLVSRIAPGATLWGLLVLYLPEDADPAAMRGLARYTDAAAAIATGYQSHNELRRWNQDRDALARLNDLAVAVHTPWAPAEVMANAANEGRRFLDCDRVVIATRQGGRYRVAAASGAATLNRRSAEIKRLERLTAAAMRAPQPLFYDETPRERPPQIEEPLQAYLDESATRRLAILPLHDSATAGVPSRGGGADPGGGPDNPGAFSTASRRPEAALIVEQMSERPLDASWRPLWLLADHAALAVCRAARLRRLPLVGPMLAAPSLRHALTRRWLPRWGLAAGLAAAVILALCLVKTDYRVRVTGQLMPVTQRHVFAPADGVVVSLQAEHGQTVAEGDPLATLSSPELDREATRLRGAIATAQRRLAAAQAQRLESLAGSGVAGRPSPAELATQTLLVEQEIATLREEQRLLQAERDRLRVVSPVDGSVITWGLQQTLAARPVARGQRLLTLADLGGPWRLELHAADRQAGPILTARAESGQGLEVRYVTAAQPERPYRATATSFRVASDADPATGENQLRFVAELTGGAHPDLRPGAEVIGQVDCGRRSLAHVWLGGLYQEFRRWFF